MKRSTSWIRRNPYGITLFLQKRIFIIFKMALITGSIICWVLIGLRCWERRGILWPDWCPIPSIFSCSGFFLFCTPPCPRALSGVYGRGFWVELFPTLPRGTLFG